MRGWTIIEVLIVLALVAIAAVIFVHGVQRWQTRPEVPAASTLDEIVPQGGWSGDPPALRRAQDPGTGWTCWVAGSGSHPGGVFCADLRAPALAAERGP